MQYKTTYYKREVKREISIERKEYEDRLDISRIEAELNNLYTANRTKFRIEELKDMTSQDISNITIDLKPNNEFHTYFTRILGLKKILENKDNCRFSDYDNAFLDKHLAENAKDGWKLISMNPILKGLFNYGNMGDGGFGYAHDVTEGFIIVWEKA